MREGPAITDLQLARQARAAGLDEMVRTSEEDGLYDLPLDTPFERLRHSTTDD